jgi:hypothetical protein
MPFCVEINPLNAKLNPICHLLILLGAHHIFHVSRIRVKGDRVHKPHTLCRAVTCTDTNLTCTIFLSRTNNCRATDVVRSTASGWLYRSLVNSAVMMGLLDFVIEFALGCTPYTRGGQPFLGGGRLKATYVIAGRLAGRTCHNHNTYCRRVRRSVAPIVWHKKRHFTVSRRKETSCRPYNDGRVIGLVTTAIGTAF